MTFSTTPSPSKVALRKILREHRQSHVLQSKKLVFLPNETIDNLFSATKRTRCIGGYVSTKFEFDPRAILIQAAKWGRQIALPYLALRNAEMEFRKWHAEDMLERAPYGFDQPKAAADRAVPDAILVPLVGFDRAMNRLGQGAGHYDRYFSINMNSLRIGLAFSCQEVDQIPVDSWDVQLDAVLTEKEWIVGANSRITS